MTNWMRRWNFSEFCWDNAILEFKETVLYRLKWKKVLNIRFLLERIWNTISYAVIFLNYRLKLMGANIHLKFLNKLFKYNRKKNQSKHFFMYFSVNLYTINELCFWHHYFSAFDKLLFPWKRHKKHILNFLNIKSPKL